MLNRIIAMTILGIKKDKSANLVSAGDKVDVLVPTGVVQA